MYYMPKMFIFLVYVRNMSKRKEIQWEPDEWRTHLENIRIMRQNRDAPVDLMGCDRLSDKNAEPKVPVLVYMVI